MSKLVILSSDLANSERDAILLDSFISDVLPIQYNDDLTKEGLLAWSKFNYNNYNNYI